jgi:exosortase D (VPLPA-CTERM-specific)
MVRRMSVDARRTPGPGPTIWRLTSPAILIFLAAVAVSLWLFWDGLFLMWGSWVESPEYSHGLLIPLVSMFLIWQRKDRLEQTRFDGSWWGTALVGLGGALLMLGQLATIYTLVQYAYLVTLFGLALSFTGRAGLRMLFMPLFALFFMVPLPQFVLANLSTKLQLLSSELGVWFMRLAGIDVFVEGNVIDLGSYKLQVAEACDGLRYLFPLMTLGFLMAYFYKGATWKRIFLFLSSIPITLLMNSFRVGTIGLMVERWGIAMAEGFLHEFQGWMMFMVSAAIMMSEIALVNRFGHEAGTWRQLFGIEFPAPSPSGARIEPRRISNAFIASSGLLLAFLVVSTLAPRPAEIVPHRESFTEFPNRLDDWTGHRDSMDGIFLEALKLDDYFLADFTKAGGQPVNLYIAFYNSQRKGEAVHSPRSCLPGGGWQLREFDQISLSNVRTNGQQLRVNRTLIELGSQRQLVYYWFKQRGRNITNEFLVKWYLFLDALTLHRTDGALIRLVIPLAPGADVADADRRLQDLAERVAPNLSRFVPD